MVDPLAAFIGSHDHYAHIFGKSVVGSAAFVVGSVLAGLIVTMHPDIPLAWWLVSGAVAAAVAEFLPIPIDDNLTIPIFAASVMTLLILVERTARSTLQGLTLDADAVWSDTTVLTSFCAWR